MLAPGEHAGVGGAVGRKDLPCSDGSPPPPRVMLMNTPRFKASMAALPAMNRSWKLKLPNAVV